MSYVTKRADSTIHQFKKRIPSGALANLKGRSLTFAFAQVGDVDPLVITVKAGEVVKFSLRAKSEDVVAARQLEAQRQLEDYVAAAMAAPTRLKHSQLVSMSRAIYEAYVAIHRDDPGSPNDWIEFKALNRAVAEGRLTDAPTLEPGQADTSGLARELFGDDLTAGINALPPVDRSGMEKRFGRLADFVLARYRMAVDAETRTKLLVQCEAAASDAARTLKANARGEYGPDKRIERFGEAFVPPTDSSVEKNGSFIRNSITSALERWWSTAQSVNRTRSTYSGYKHTVKLFVDFLEHDDLDLVGKGDVVRFRDFRLKSVSAKTVKDGDLVALKSIFKQSFSDGVISSNPASGITLPSIAQTFVRDNWFTDGEAASLLRNASMRKKSAREGDQMFQAKRWVPWLCAYTGSRVGEMAQLRKQDVRQEGDVWVIRVTPDAGPVKNKTARDIVMHEHLVELGFPTFVKGCPEGWLFLSATRLSEVNSPLRTVKNKLAEASRKIVKDQNVDPNHGWRHRFKTITRDININARVADAIQGHKIKTISDRYGGVTIAAMTLAMSLFPRVDLSVGLTDVDDTDDDSVVDQNPSQNADDGSPSMAVCGEVTPPA